MDFETFELLMQQTSSFCSSYNLHGIGESLLHPDFFKCVQRVKQEGVLCRLTTNGLKLTPGLSRDLIEAGMDSITFSVDAGTAETYRLIRRSNAFDRLAGNIKTLADIRSELGRDRPKITTAFVCNQQNIHDLPAFVDWSAEVGADLVFVQGYDDRGWGEQHKLSTRDRFVRILKATEEQAEHREMPLQYEYPERMAIETGRRAVGDLPVWDPDPSRDTELPRYSACEATWVHGIVRANGDIDTCWFGETLGNIADETFLEIWNGPRIRDFRQRQRSITEPPPPCCEATRGWHYCNPAETISDTLAMGGYDFRQLGAGWYQPEQDHETNYRFTDSTADAFLRNTGKGYLTLRMCVYSATSSPETREVEVLANGRRVATVLVESIWREYTLKLPYLRGRFIQVSLAVDHTRVPCKVAESFDFRRIGVAVSLIALQHYGSE